MHYKLIFRFGWWVRGLIIMMRWCVETINTCSQTFSTNIMVGFRYYIWVFSTLFFPFFSWFHINKNERKKWKTNWLLCCSCNLCSFIINLHFGRLFLKQNRISIFVFTWSNCINHFIYKWFNRSCLSVCDSKLGKPFYFIFKDTFICIIHYSQAFFKFIDCQFCFISREFPVQESFIIF